MIEPGDRRAASVACPIVPPAVPSDLLGSKQWLDHDAQASQVDWVAQYLRGPVCRCRKRRSDYLGGVAKGLTFGAKIAVIDPFPFEIRAETVPSLRPDLPPLMSVNMDCWAVVFLVTDERMTSVDLVIAGIGEERWPFWRGRLMLAKPERGTNLGLAGGHARNVCLSRTLQYSQTALSCSLRVKDWQVPTGLCAGVHPFKIGGNQTRLNGKVVTTNETCRNAMAGGELKHSVAKIAVPEFTVSTDCALRNKITRGS